MNKILLSHHSWGDLVPSCIVQNEDAPNVLYIANKRYHLFNILFQINMTFLVVKNLSASAGDAGLIPALGQEDPLEEEMATHSSILAWRIVWTEEPGRLQSMGSQRVGRD